MYFTSYICTECITLITRVIYNTLLIQYVTGNCVIPFITRATDTQVIFLRESCFKHFILPIYTWILTSSVIVRSRRVYRFSCSRINSGCSRIRYFFICPIILIKHLSSLITIFSIRIAIQHIHLLHHF